MSSDLYRVINNCICYYFFVSFVDEIFTNSFRVVKVTDFTMFSSFAIATMDFETAGNLVFINFCMKSGAYFTRLAF